MIVNPWFFYAMSFCNNLKVLTILLSIFGGAAAVHMTITYCVGVMDGNFDEDDEISKIFLKALHFIYWMVGVSIVFTVLLPNEETLLMMQAAKLATTENVNSVFEAFKAAMDYAVTILR